MSPFRIFYCYSPGTKSIKGCQIFSENGYFAQSVQFSSVAQSYPTLRDPMNHNTPDLPINHQPPEFTQTHVH